jgi:hypothetical protein
MHGDASRQSQKIRCGSLWSKWPSLLGKFPITERDKDKEQNGKMGRLGGT